MFKIQDIIFLGWKLLSSQVYDGTINVTLQAAARVICDSLNRLSDSGVPIPGYDDVAES